MGDREGEEGQEGGRDGWNGSIAGTVLASELASVDGVAGLGPLLGAGRSKSPCSQSRPTDCSRVDQEGYQVT